jgi:predicted dehydrogenase
MSLRIGLVGCGYMGTLHARKLAQLAAEDATIRFVGVADVDLERAEALGKRHSVPAFAEGAQLVPDLDALIVAVPTVEHFKVVQHALECSIDVLVEKPVAANLAEAQALLDGASRAGLVMQVGHLERFNGALQAIQHRVDQPRYIEAHRLGPFSERAMDIDVVRDLMIHDLDILQQLLGEEPERIEAVGVPVVSPNVDIANARLTYPSGCVANLTASRVSATPTRRIRFFQPGACISADFLAQSAVVAHRKRGADGARPSFVVEEIDAARGDALLAQLRAFVHAVLSRERPLADGPRAIGALRTALRINAAMRPPNALD